MRRIGGLALPLGLLLCLLIACGGDAPPSNPGPVDPTDPTPGEPVNGQTDPSIPSTPSTPYTPPKPVMYVHSGTELYKIDPDTLQLALVGSFGADAPHMTDMAVTPDGLIYTVSFNHLYVVDPITAKATWVAKVPGAVNVALTFDTDGTLLASDKEGSLHRVDPKQGTVTQIGFYGDGYGSSGDLVAIKDGTLFGVNDVGGAASNNELITVDPKTGVATTVGKIGFRLVWGLAFWGGTVYGMTRSGQLLAIDPQTGAGTVISEHDIEFWGAGVTPLAPLTID